MTTNIRTGLRCTLVAGGLLLAGARSFAADPPATGDVLAKLHQSDEKEIAAGKLAEKNGKSQQVKDYGKMLVKDHSAADKKVSTLAKQEKVDLGAAMPAMKADHDMSAMAADPNFDVKFAREMLEDHKQAIADVTAARDATTDDKLKKLLSDVLPTLQKHEDAAQKILDTEGKK
jgi:putative membrane protein